MQNCSFYIDKSLVLIYDMKQLKGGDTMFQTQSMNLDLVRTFVIVCQSKDYNDAASKLKIDATSSISQNHHFYHYFYYFE